MTMPDRRALRTGYTTGACATAATKAAMLMLLEGRSPGTVSITLPNGMVAGFRVACSLLDAEGARCCVVKDAGDDPDITNGIEVWSSVRFDPAVPAGEIAFRKGDGVGTVTLPGLGIPVGEPAVNPVPRSMIAGVIAELLAGRRGEGGVAVSISVPGGAGLAGKTLNERVGVVGGISILGTTGIVVPYSREAYLDSIRQSIRVAIDNGCTELVLNSGTKSEGYLRNMLPGLPLFAFLHYGNWIGRALSMIGDEPRCRKVTVGVMLAKASKLAAGHLDTSSRTVGTDPAFLEGLARELGYPGPVCEAIAGMQMVRSLEGIVPFRPDEPLYREIASRCHRACSALVPGKQLDFVLVMFDGGLLVDAGDALSEKP